MTDICEYIFLLEETKTYSQIYVILLYKYRQLTNIVSSKR